MEVSLYQISSLMQVVVLFYLHGGARYVYWRWYYLRYLCCFGEMTLFLEYRPVTYIRITVVTCDSILLYDR